MTENHTHTTDHTSDHELAEGLVQLYAQPAGNAAPRVVITPDRAPDGDCTYALDSFGVDLADAAVALEVCLAAVNDELEHRAEATS